MNKVLLISYYFDPYNGVGAKRLTYWANAFQAEREIECTVITAIPRTAHNEHIFYVPDPNGWENNLIYGASWISPLKKYLSNCTGTFDYAIISGGPFGHFPIVSFLKKRFNCKVILDFRDPFSGNVRFGSSRFVEFLKLRFEKRLLAQADHILTVNDCCREILLKNTLPEKVCVVENGYDEKTVDAIVSEKIEDGNTHIVHAGKFYKNCLPFAQAIVEWNKTHPNRKFVFHHIGDENAELQGLGSPEIRQHGIKSYEETIAIMKTATIGFVLTGGELLEYNTKIFDYIGCDLDIFVVTEGEIQTGCINRLTTKLGDKVFWAKSTNSGIHDLLERYRPTNRNFTDKIFFSRLAGFDRLKQIMLKDMSAI